MTWALGLGIPLFFCGMVFSLFLVFDDAELISAANDTLALFDRVMGIILFLPPYLSWAVVGFLAGALVHFGVWEARRVTTRQRLTLLSAVLIVMLLLLLVQPFFLDRPQAGGNDAVRANAGPLVPTGPGGRRGAWWRPDSYRQAGAERVFEGITFVWVPAGVCVMGSPQHDRDRTVDETRRQAVFRRGFWMSRCELGWGDYLRVMREPPPGMTPPDDLNLPVSGLSLEQARAVARRMNHGMPGPFALPTEAQWEHACRADTTARFYFGDDAETLPQHAWFSENSGGKPHACAELPPNPWNLRDILGNVAEWCDGLGVLEHAANGTPEYEVFRGGSWQSGAAQCRAAARGIHIPGQTTPPEDVGIRLVREP